MVADPSSRDSQSELLPMLGLEARVHATQDREVQVLTQIRVANFSGAMLMARGARVSQFGILAWLSEIPGVRGSCRA